MAPVERGGDLVNTDIGAERNEFLFKAPAFLNLESYVIDKRDWVMAHLLFNITVTTVPLAIINMFLLKDYPLILRHAVGFATVAWNYGVIFGRFNDLLHYSEHRRAFRSKLFHRYINFILAPFLGVPCGMYHLHHVVMHHVEANLFPYDVTSTLPYQRDSFKQWIGYALRFALCCWVELPYYAVKRRRLDLARAFTINAIIYFIVNYFAYSYNSVAAFYLFTVPYFVTFFFFTFGNWSQHIFVVPESPDSAYCMTYNCINEPDNQRCFNDGYHIIHHLHSKKHWSEMPQYFQDTIDEHVKHDSFTFHSRHFLAIGYWAFTGNYDALYEHFVTLPGQRKRTKEELIEEMKRRLQPITTTFD